MISSDPQKGPIEGPFSTDLPKEIIIKLPKIGSRQLGHSNHSNVSADMQIWPVAGSKIFTPPSDICDFLEISRSHIHYPAELVKKHSALIMEHFLHMAKSEHPPQIMPRNKDSLL